MCGRYALAGDWSDFAEEFALEEVPCLVSRFNIAPTSGPGFEAPILVEPQVLVPARFWFIPSWWGKSRKELPSTFNARSETASSMPLFREAGRCLVPTSGWREFPGPSGKKQAFNFEVHDEAREHRRFFAFGGLWSKWFDPEIEESTYTFAILTTEPNSVVRPYHHRMPLLVPQRSYRDWLDETAGYGNLLSDANRHTRVAQLHHYECSTFGNSTRVEGPGCIQPLTARASLF